MPDSDLTRPIHSCSYSDAVRLSDALAEIADLRLRLRETEARMSKPADPPKRMLVLTLENCDLAVQQIAELIASSLWVKEAVPIKVRVEELHDAAPMLWVMAREARARAALRAIEGQV